MKKTGIFLLVLCALIFQGCKREEADVINEQSAVYVGLIETGEESKSQEEILVATVDGAEIYQSDIDRVFNEVLRGYSFDGYESEIEYKRAILENGIDEIIVVNEAIARGLSADVEMVQYALESLQMAQPELYQRAIETYGEERYAADVGNRFVYNQMRDNILSEVVFEISEEELYEWYLKQEGALEVDYEFFLENNAGVEECWIESKQEEYFSAWVTEARSKHEIEYYNAVQ